MFSVGDKVMYGSTGVCTIIDICVPDLPGTPRECYILKPQYVPNSKIYAPVENNPTNIRPLLTPSQAQSLIDNLDELAPFPADMDKQEMHETCRSAVKSADCSILARLLKTLYEKRVRLSEQRKTIPIAEKEYFDTAEKMLHGEFATVLQIPIDEVDGYIADRLGRDYGTAQVSAS